MDHNDPGCRTTGSKPFAHHFRCGNIHYPVEDRKEMKQEYFICPFCHKRTKVSRLSDNIVRCLKCNKTGDKKDFFLYA